MGKSLRNYWISALIWIVASIAVGAIGVETHKYVRELQKQIVVEKEKNKTCIEHDRRINDMTRTLMIAYSLSKWEAHYYAIIFDDFSEQFNIPWEIYPAIVRIESNFKCNVGSPKGAKGMMQILEGTGKSIAGKYEIDYVENQTLWNTVLNLVLGCGYLSQNIKEKGLEGGVKSYLGGANFAKTVITNPEAKQYIGEYRSTVWKEYLKLSYFYRGVRASELSVYREAHPYQDSIPLNWKLFISTEEFMKGEDNGREKSVGVGSAETGRAIDSNDTSRHP
jgi:hypothetical protein